MTVVRKPISGIVVNFEIVGETIHHLVPDAHVAFIIGEKTVIAKGCSIELGNDNILAASSPSSDPAKAQAAAALPPRPRPPDNRGTDK
jgi:hypothetical protein